MSNRILLFLVLLIGAPAFAQEAPERPRNIVMMIPDGFGPASTTLARLATGEPLALDEIATGQVGTTSSSHHITDSAAGATAYAAGIKTFNGAIAVDDDRQPVGTILQGARDRGLSTGLVTTTELTHATPAAFAAHVESRREVFSIAAQMLENRVDLLLGGGRSHFEPGDDRPDLLAEAHRAGYHLVESAEELEAAGELPVLGLFADRHLAYAVDRHRTDQPSLAEMSRKALDLLSPNPQGFFLMIEAGRIDHAAHLNDPVGHLFDILAFDEAVAAVLDFARDEGNTLVVVAADHETGGLTLGRDGSSHFDPDILLQSSASLEWMMGEAVRRSEEGEEPSAEMLAEILAQVSPVGDLDDEDRYLLDAALDFQESFRTARFVTHVISRRAGVDWSTTGHTAVDVTLHAFGPGSERLTGFRENDEVGRIVADLLGIDLEAVTRRVRASLEAQTTDL